MIINLILAIIMLLCFFDSVLDKDSDNREIIYLILFIMNLFCYFMGNR